jgi:hypothetical protein
MHLKSFLSELLIWCGFYYELILHVLKQHFKLTIRKKLALHQRLNSNGFCYRNYKTFKELCPVYTRADLSIDRDLSSVFKRYIILWYETSFSFSKLSNAFLLILFSIAFIKFAKLSNLTLNSLNDNFEY